MVDVEPERNANHHERTLQMSCVQEGGIATIHISRTVWQSGKESLLTDIETSIVRYNPALRSYSQKEEVNMYVSSAGQEMERMGFTLIGTGGGCYAYSRTVDKYFVLITDADGCNVPKDIDKPILLGVYLDGDQPVQILSVYLDSVKSINDIVFNV